MTPIAPPMRAVEETLFFWHCRYSLLSGYTGSIQTHVRADLSHMHVVLLAPGLGSLVAAVGSASGT